MSMFKICSFIINLINVKLNKNEWMSNNNDDDVNDSVLTYILISLIGTISFYKQVGYCG